MHSASAASAPGALRYPRCCIAYCDRGVRDCHEITSPIRSLLRTASGVARRPNTGQKTGFGSFSYKDDAFDNGQATPFSHEHFVFMLQGVTLLAALLAARSNNLALGLIILRQLLARLRALAGTGRFSRQQALFVQR
ncbi:MAG: hypothetical protein ACI9DC_002820 [Gammaproteobacteria bacterium]|jgi:hypothetical protein